MTSSPIKGGLVEKIAIPADNSPAWGLAHILATTKHDVQTVWVRVFIFVNIYSFGLWHLHLISIPPKNNKGAPPPAVLETSLICGLFLQAVSHAVTLFVNISCVSDVELHPTVTTASIKSTEVFIIYSCPTSR